MTSGIQGLCSPRFEGVRTAFESNFAGGFEVGASVVLIVDGRVEVDLWGGHADDRRREPWRQDTIVNVWSTTKTMMFLVCLMLADRGLIELDAPVARYWPEFAANGKSGVSVGHLMSHSAGLSGWDAPMSEADLWNHSKCASLLAAQAPWWEPGSVSGYHAITQGYLLGELVRRVTGESLGSFFKRELAGPLGADFHIGTPPICDSRLSLVIPAEAGLPPELDPAGVAARTFLNPAMDARMAHSVEWRRCESPAANGHGNARSVARVQSVLSHGGEIDGRRYLSEAMCRRVLEEQTYGMDLVLGMPVRFGRGYGLPSNEQPVGGPGACFWGGWGGSLVVNDLDRRMTFAYVMNRMGDGTVGDLRGGALLLAAYGALA